MIKDNVNMGQQDSEVLALKMMTGDFHDVKMTGQSIDRIFKNGKLVDEIVGHNLVVNSFLNLVMCLLKQQSGYTGIQYWAVGSGAPSWDTNMPTPELTATRLTAEIGRVPIIPIILNIYDIRPDLAVNLLLLEPDSNLAVACLLKIGEYKEVFM